METSATIGKLAEALAKAQAKIKEAELDCVNPHFKSKYASLSSVRNAYREAFAANGLALSEAVSSDGDGYVLETKLMHSSGEWQSAKMRLLIDRPTMQGLGSAITYGKRYQAAAMTGVVEGEDDDGNEASKFPGVRPAAAMNPRSAPLPPSSGGPHGDALAALRRLVESKGLNAEVNQYCAEVLKVSSPLNLSMQQIQELTSLIQKGTIKRADTVAHKIGVSLPHDPEFDVDERDVK